MPLHAQEADTEYFSNESVNEYAEGQAHDDTEQYLEEIAKSSFGVASGIGSNENAAAAESKSPAETPAPKKTAKPKEHRESIFARKYFEFGLGVGAGFDNGLIGINDINKKNIVVDINKFAKEMDESGTNINVDLLGDFYFNIMNIRIGQGIWDFGIISTVSGGVSGNIEKPLFSLIADGNIKAPHTSSGTISAWGGVYTDVGLTGSAKYGKIYFGVKPAIFSPKIYIPISSGITYNLAVNGKDKNDKNAEGIFVTAKGEIDIFSPTSLDENIDIQRLIFGPSGFDLSIEGGYMLFPFLDVGGSISHIPFAAATLTNPMRLTMVLPEGGLKFIGEELMKGEVDDSFTVDFNQENIKSSKKQVRRPFRFDVNARFKPFAFTGINPELFVLTPNMGFTANINDNEGYFNIGLAAVLNLADVFLLQLSTSKEESIYKQRLGLVFNLRAFELSLEGVLRSQTFSGCFDGQGFGIGLGLCWGW